jgi:acetyl-CoA carboxylase biotin carboxyl carrier protein
MKGGGKRERGSAKAGPSSGADRRAARSAAGEASGGSDATVEMARQLAAIVETHSLSELVVDTPSLTLTLRRGGWSSAAGGAHPMMAAIPPAPVSMPVAHAPAFGRPVDSAPAASAGAAGAAAAPAKPDADHHVVTSPFVGTFYSSPGPDSEPYVSLGQKVDRGQVLCIVEAMKLMNEIEADKPGVVVAVLVENAQPVEYGQPLFRLSPK